MFDRQSRRLWAFVVAATVATTVGLTPSSTSAAPTIPGPPPTALPDFVGNGSAPKTVGASQSFTFKMLLANRGAASAFGSPLAVVGWLPHRSAITQVSPPEGVTCHYNNDSLGPDSLFGRPIIRCEVHRPMLPNSDIVVVMQVQAPAYVGVYSMSVLADYSPQIPESNETNNNQDREIKVQ
jgi:hypothetical protein